MCMMSNKVVIIFVCKPGTLLKEILLKHTYKYNDVIRPFGYERVYTPFYIQGDGM